MHLPLLLLVLACSDEAVVPQGDGPPPALVRTAEVTSGDLVEQWQAMGSVRALQAAELAAGASGPVASVTAREGDAVEVDFTFLPNLMPGDYTLTVGLGAEARPGGVVKQPLFRHQDIASFTLMRAPDDDFWDGLVNLQPQVACRRMVEP